MGILTRKDGVYRFWWWNRFTAWTYHKMHGIDPRENGEFGFDHMSKCKHCKSKFEKWQAKQDA